jgi:hypothetical protein
MLPGVRYQTKDEVCKCFVTESAYAIFEQLARLGMQGSRKYLVSLDVCYSGLAPEMIKIQTQHINIKGVAGARDLAHGFITMVTNYISTEAIKDDNYDLCCRTSELPAAEKSKFDYFWRRVMENFTACVHASHRIGTWEVSTKPPDVQFIECASGLDELFQLSWKDDADAFFDVLEQEWRHLSTSKTTSAYLSTMPDFTRVSTTDEPVVNPEAREQAAHCEHPRSEEEQIESEVPQDNGYVRISSSKNKGSA